MPIVDFITPDYEASSPTISPRTLINWFPESTEGKGKSPVILKGTPATKTFTKNTLPPSSIEFIKGNGGFPNNVLVKTFLPHGLTNNQIISIVGTSGYNEGDIGSVIVVNDNEFRYSTENNQTSIQETAGQVDTEGDADIVGATGGCRGLYTSSTGRLFGCYGGGLFEIFPDGSSQLKFNLSQSPKRISMADNGLTLCLVDGVTMYLMELDTGVVQTPVLPFQKPIKVFYSNKRIVCINEDLNINVGGLPTNNSFYWCDPITAIDNGINNWHALNFASAESSADPIISGAVVQGQLWFFGTRSYEVWDIDENPDLPFRYVGGSSTEVGCRAKDSVYTIAGNVFWMGSSASGENQIFMSNGFSHQRISDHALESWLNKLGSSNNDAVGFTYQQEGHVFYVINFIAGNRTYVFDTTSGMWHRRATRDQLTDVNNRWQVLYASSAFGLTLCGAVDIPRVFTLDLYVFQEWDGRPIVREIQSPIYWGDYRTQFHNEFQVDMATGVGTQQNTPIIAGIQNNQGSDPQIMLQYSDDSGQTWSSELWAPIGKVGEYQTRVKWRRLGSARFRVYRIRISDPVQATILGARAIFNMGVAK